MRIAFVTPYGSEYRNINKHTSIRLDEWRKAGHPTSQFLIGDNSRKTRSALANLVRDSIQSRELVRGVAQYRPDLVCVRWLTPIPALTVRLAEIAPVVLEIHGSDLVEASGSRVRKLYMQAFRERALRAASGACFTVAELAKDADFSSLAGLPQGIFPNGTRMVRRNAQEARSVPVVGMAVASAHPRFGLDHVRRLSVECQDLKFVVACPTDVVGEVASEVGPQVEVRPNSSDDEYYAELSSWTVALGTLAQQRAGQTSGNPLKVRDYLGIGVPTVVPYVDGGLVGLHDPALALLASPTAPFADLSADWLSKFAHSMNGRNVMPATSAHVAVENIEAKRLEFFRQVAEK